MSIMNKYGLIGYSLGHSFSKKFFEDKFKAEKIEGQSYQLYPLKNMSNLPALIKEEGLDGFNVTIPYKTDVMPFLDHIDALALKIGAVNCVSVDKSADQVKLAGYNTDAIGFENSLKPLLSDYHNNALILGSGGASKAVSQVLENLGIAYKVVSRYGGDLRYEEVDAGLMSGHTLIVNTTPLGMYPNVEEEPNLPLECLTKRHLVYDLIYNPVETKLLKKAVERGASIKNGLEMLVIQAEASWDIWKKLR